mmetsp:Transcript_10874/g.21856  ORF Transcript_10874/g.21856 Transcript_10874/m.21856 type:complete len:181 (-) Transcript_10874:99-641(-)|eukprot:CAMPEP_0181313366 /NCGR_PEP_ID=MMETSP1101-20121128/14209_1 /TAXON_ID=46948 /ORGANISM="Rhodomonas abbreviata, Strain Caron Lab Isolate" /LENGTH=180 /DNA_ID=CAMNT_0023420313 /DNA_START=116 /DNA_END=658 /DNA_ORIENTATION=+
MSRQISTPPTEAGSRRTSPSLKEVLVENSHVPGAMDNSFMVSGHDFGIPACTRDDFMELQVSVSKAFERAEERAGRSSPSSGDEEFAHEVSEEIDTLCDDLEALKDLLVKADANPVNRSEVEGEVMRLKQQIRNILEDLDEREQTIAYAAWEGQRRGAERNARDLTRRSDTLGMESLGLK